MLPSTQTDVFDQMTAPMEHKRLGMQGMQGMIGVGRPGPEIGVERCVFHGLASENGRNMEVLRLKEVVLGGCRGPWLSTKCQIR